ncbi:MAG TPA: hypothetical protein VG228_05215 [Solirubrobacteraceae bacterium]|nr:hypothetical protein [Solirubrobacteraceae bacterium]
MGFVAIAAMIALAAAGGAIVIIPLALVAVVAAAAWYVLFRAIGAERMGTAETAHEVRTRSAEAAYREVNVNKLADGELPGGAEGGDDSPSARWIALPSHDGTPWGDTDQHSSAARTPMDASNGR